MSRYYKLDGSEAKDLREARKCNAVPSVTTVINATAPHEYKYLDSKRIKEILSEGYLYDEAIEILDNNPVFEAGTMVHEAAEVFLITGIKSTLKDYPNSSRQLYKYLEKLKPLGIETYYEWPEGGTGGKIDLVAYRGTTRIIVDYKTASVIKKKPSKTWLLQLGAYYAGCVANDLLIEGAEILQFCKKDSGVYPLQVSKEELIKASKIFLLLREAFEYYHDI